MLTPLQMQTIFKALVDKEILSSEDEVSLSNGLIIYWYKFGPQSILVFTTLLPGHLANNVAECVETDART